MAGTTPVFDGSGDLLQHGAGNRMTPGATLGSADEVGVSWDSENLYITVVSSGFSSTSKPAHIYIEAAQQLGNAAQASGKEYSSLTPQLPFAPNYLVAFRRTSDLGTGPYNALFTPANSWDTQQKVFVEGTDIFTDSGADTISVVVPWSELGCPKEIRMAAHLVNEAAGNEWKDLVPATHTPWMSSSSGYYEIDLVGDIAISNWTEN